MNIYDVDMWQNIGYAILSIAFAIAVIWFVTNPFHSGRE